jgi:hypothetical protein
MPCSYYDPNEVTTDKHTLERLHQCEAVLCAVVRMHGLEHVRQSLDSECGITKTQVTEWWNQHEKEDSRRISEENRRNKNEVIRLEQVIADSQAQLQKALKKVKK